MSAVIFDCDGVLVDSEPVYSKAFSQALAAYGLDLKSDFLRQQLRGKTMADCYQWLAQQYDFQATEPFIASLFEITDQLLITDVQPIKGVKDIVSEIKVPKAVASNGMRRSVLGNLTRCGLADFFGDAIFTADLVAKPKPAPDIYLYAAQQLGQPAEQCFVVEDSPLGVKAALAAGMNVCCITHGELKPEQIDQVAHISHDMAGVRAWLARAGQL